MRKKQLAEAIWITIGMVLISVASHETGLAAIADRLLQFVAATTCVYIAIGER